ncbi:MAG: long-chain fatty acid--CoA ligase [Ignavibacteriae bacterium]|nr:MAG: long-chain fatty acid--CoA ligase [Ignavibacteriota bacterium]
MVNNFCTFFLNTVNKYGTRNALYWRESKQSGKDSYNYESLSGNKLKELVYHAAKALKKLNLNPNDKAAIISETRFEWVVSDFACIFNRVITVPIYPTMTASQMKFILEHSAAKVCFASTKYIVEKIKSVFHELPELKYIISFNKPENEPEYVLFFEDLIYQSILQDKNSYSDADADNLIDNCRNNINENDILTIIYTSGTMGNPKGVSLTHKNILTNIESAKKAFPMLSEKDKFLSFLPLAHSYERTAGYYLALSLGAEIYYAQNIDTLQTQFLEVKPTIIIAVPLLYSRIYSRLMKSVQAMPKRKQVLVKAAFKIARKMRNNKSGFLWQIADRLVFGTIRERTGGEMRFSISGGSALNKDIAEFFEGIGLPMYEGYGMTEAAPVISCNRPGKNKIGTVGLPLDGVEVKIADDGEILVKGDNVMPGYFNNEKDTNETVINGWLHTGDMGEKDADGFLKITGRKKSLIKTEGGKYISLAHIEETLENSKYIEQVITFAGDDKPFVSALIVPDFEELKSYSSINNITSDNNIELIENPLIKKLFENEIAAFQQHHAKYERVRKFTLLPYQFTIESGELTPSLKLKRKVIEDKFREVIYGMYRKGS